MLVKLVRLRNMWLCSRTFRWAHFYQIRNVDVKITALYKTPSLLQLWAERRG